MIIENSEKINEIVRQLCLEYQLEPTDQQSFIFLNHLVTFLERYQKDEKLNLDLDDALLSQIDSNVMVDAKKFLLTLIEKLKITPNKANINDAEIFLVATHFINIQNNN